MNLVNLFGDFVDIEKIDAIECCNETYWQHGIENIVLKSKIHLSSVNTFMVNYPVDDVVSLLEDVR